MTIKLLRLPLESLKKNIHLCNRCSFIAYYAWDNYSSLPLQPNRHVDLVLITNWTEMFLILTLSWRCLLRILRHKIQLTVCFLRLIHKFWHIFLITLCQPLHFLPNFRMAIFLFFKPILFLHRTTLQIYGRHSSKFNGRLFIL